MDILRLFTDYSIPFITEGNKHSRQGWINVCCPFCDGSQDYHLGFEINNPHFFCWRCGWHPIPLTISKLLNIKEKESLLILKDYQFLFSKKLLTKVITQAFKLPSNSNPLQKNHRDYLINRNFDPNKIIKEWGVLGTSFFSRLSKFDGAKKIEIDYKFRIIIPFYWNGRVVSFDSRDITGKHKSKYMACPASREITPHKNILYCNQEKIGKVGIAVEGPFDVWRFGSNSFATSGIQFTSQQIKTIAKMFDRVPVCFDGNELEAKKQANLLVSELKFRGVDSFRVDINGDPGSMEQSEADYLIKTLIK